MDIIDTRIELKELQMKLLNLFQEKWIVQLINAKT